MAAFIKFNSFVEALGQKKHNLNADTLKVLLTNVAPAAGNAVKADITEIAPGNGYNAGGAAVPGNTFVQAAGVAKLAASGDVQISASGAVGPFRWAVLYNDTAANDELIGAWDYGSSQTLQAGESVKVKTGQAAGILTVG